MFNWFINIFARKDSSIQKTAKEAEQESKNKYREQAETDSAADYSQTIENELASATENYDPSAPMFTDEQLESAGLKYLITPEQNTKGFWANVITAYFTTNNKDLGAEFSTDKLRTLQNKGLNAFLDSKAYKEDATTGLYILLTRFLSNFNLDKLGSTKEEIKTAIESANSPEAIKQNAKKPKTRKLDSNYIKLLQQSINDADMDAAEKAQTGAASDVEHTQKKLDKAVRLEVLNLLFTGICKSFYTYCSGAGSNLLGNITKKLYSNTNDQRVVSMDAQDNDDDDDNFGDDEQVGNSLAERLADPSQAVDLVDPKTNTPAAIRERVNLATYLAKQIMAGMPGMQSSGLLPLFKLKYLRDAKKVLRNTSPKEDVVSADPHASKLLLIPTDSEIKDLIHKDYDTMTFPDKFAVLFGTAEAKTVKELKAERDGVELAAKFLGGHLLNNTSGAPTDSRKMNLDQYQTQVDAFLKTLKTDEEKASARSFLSVDFVDRLSAALAKKREKAYGSQQTDLRKFTHEIVEDLTNQIREVLSLSKANVADRVETWLRQRKEYSNAVAKRMYHTNFDKLNSVLSYLDTEYDFLQNNARKSAMKLNKENNEAEVLKKDSRAAARYDIASFVTKQRDFLIDRLSTLENTVIQDKKISLDVKPIIDMLKNADAIKTRSGQPVESYKTASQLASVARNEGFEPRIRNIHNAVLDAIKQTRAALNEAGVDGSRVVNSFDTTFAKGNDYHLTTYIPSDFEQVGRMYHSVVPEVARRVQNDNESGREMQEFKQKETDYNIRKLEKDLEKDKKLYKQKEEELNKKNTDGTYVLQDEDIISSKVDELQEIKDRIENREKFLEENKQDAKKWKAENPFPDLNKIDDVTLHSEIKADDVLYLYDTKEAVALDHGKYYKVFRTPGSDELILAHKPVPEPAITDPALVSYTGKGFVRFFIEDRNTGKMYPVKDDKLTGNLKESVSPHPFTGEFDARLLGDLKSYSIEDLNEKMTAQKIRISHENSDANAAKKQQLKDTTDKNNAEFAQWEKEKNELNDKEISKEVADEDYFLKRDFGMTREELEKYMTELIKKIYIEVDPSKDNAREVLNKAPVLRNIYDKLKEIEQFYKTKKTDKKYTNEKGEPLEVSILRPQPEALADAITVIEDKLRDVVTEYGAKTGLKDTELPTEQQLTELRDAVNNDRDLDPFEVTDEDNTYPSERLNYKQVLQEEPKQEESKPEEKKQEDHTAGFSFSGLQKTAAPFFHISRVALDMTDNQLQKEIEDPSLVQTPDEMVADKNNNSNETLLSGQKSQEQDIQDSKSFKTKKVAQALKMAYDADPSHELFNTLVQVVRDSNPTTGPATADALSHLPETQWSMEAAYRMYNESNVAESHDRHYFQECLRRDGWPAMLKNDQFVQLLKKSNEGQA